MSDQPTNLPTQEQAAEAYSYLAQEYFMPALFTKLASAYNIKPKNKTEMAQLLQLGDYLAAAEAQGQLPQPEETPNPFLTHVLQKAAAMAAPAGSPQEDANAQFAAKQIVTQDPLAKTAALLYGYCAAGGPLAEAAA
jgi:adenine-specific DNA glycosylase